jgi:hypothetical protein
LYFNNMEACFMAHHNSHSEPAADSQPRGANSGLDEDAAAVRTINSREQLRRQLAEQVEAFLARGGAIEQLSPNATGDPITRPSSDYGGRSI